MNASSSPPSTGASPRRGPRNIGLSDLRAYRLPLPAKVSILHRASGALLFLSLPLLLQLFDSSLSSERSFRDFSAFADSLGGRVVFTVLGWALLHHLCAGIRFLLLDLHIGVERSAARRGAGVVLGCSLALTALLALRIFGVWQ
jgi:succinate dehydrogenase / fumarate reductase cytochrome b subunit